MNCRRCRQLSLAGLAIKQGGSRRSTALEYRVSLCSPTNIMPLFTRVSSSKYTTWIINFTKCNNFVT